MSYAARPMSPGEKYFAFLDRIVPMNMMFVADLDTVLPGSLVEQQWPRYSAARALTRMRTGDDLTMSDGPPSGDVSVRPTPSQGWDAVLDELARDRLGPGRPMRCVYLPSPAEGRSRLVLVVHHSVVDGRVCVAELQNLVRHLDGQDVPEQRELTVPVERPDAWPWQRDRKALIELLRDIGARNAGAGEVQPLGWQRPNVPRRPRFVSVLMDRDDSSAVLRQARAHGASAYPALAANWLVSAAARLGTGPSPTFQLGTPADIAGTDLSPGLQPAPAVSVLATRYRVSGDVWPLAAEVAAALREVRSRGEDALFFHLTRVAAMNDVRSGAEAVARALAAAPPSVSVTNLGVVDPGSDPEWVTSVCGYLAPSPNNVLFVSGSGYRGRIVQSVAYDDVQLERAVATSIIDGFRELTRAT